MKNQDTKKVKLNETLNETKNSSKFKNMDNTYLKTMKNLNVSILYSKNDSLINKNETGKGSYTNFYPVETTIVEFIEHISKGLAFAPANFHKNYRLMDNFHSVHMWAGDVDSGITIEQALEIDFIRDNFYIYTSCSHNPEAPKFRLITHFPVGVDQVSYKQFSEDIDLMLAQHVYGKEYIENNPETRILDQSTKKIDKLFYGNSNAQWYNLENYRSDNLPISFFIDLEKRGRLNKRKEDRELETKQSRLASRQYKLENEADFSNLSDKTTKEIITTFFTKYLPPHVSGSGTYHWFNESKNVRGYLFLYKAAINCLGDDGWAIIEDHIATNDDKYTWVKSVKGLHENFNMGTILNACRYFGYNPKLVYKHDFNGKFTVFEDARYTEDDFYRDLDFKEYSEFQETLIREINKELRNPKGFGNKDVRIPDLEPELIIYNPDKPLPKPSDYNNTHKNITPKIIIESDNIHEKARVITKLKRNGWKNMFDTSQTGAGKSKVITLLNNVVYADKNYQNPSNREMRKSFHAIAPRTLTGIWKDNDTDHIVVNPSIEMIKNDNISYLKGGNCPRVNLFRFLEDKGYNSEENKMPCEKCMWNESCTKMAGLFKFDRKHSIANGIKAGRIRAHVSQLTQDLFLNDEFSDWSLVWEEAGSLETKKDLTFSYYDARQMATEFVTILVKADKNNYLKYDQLTDSLLSLCDLLADEDLCKEISKKRGTFHGLDYHQLIEYFKDIPELSEEEFKNLQSIVEEHRVLKLPPVEKIKPEMQMRLLRETIMPNLMIFIKAILPQFNDHIMSINKNEDGSLSFTISYLNDSYRKIREIANFNIFLDATATIKQIKGKYDIDPVESFICIESVVKSIDNVGATVINVGGLKSNNFTRSGIKKVNYLIEQIKSTRQNKKIAVMTHKRYVKNGKITDADRFWYHNHDRGTNELMDYDVIIYVGTPNLHVNDVKNEYYLEYGDSNIFTFDEFYAQKLYESRIQGAGRQRAQWQKSRDFEQFYITSDEDVSYLKELGAQFKYFEAGDLFPNCKTKGESTYHKIKTVAIQLYKAGKKFTQQIVSKIARISPTGLRKSVRNFGGGWKQFKTLIMDTVKTYNEVVGRYDRRQEELESQFSWFTKEWRQDPENAIDVAIDLLSGKDGKSQLISTMIESGMSRNTALEMLWCMSPIWDDRCHELLTDFLTQNT